MNYEQFCENLLTLDHRVVYVGIVDNQPRLMHSKFREGAELHSTPAAVRKFMTIAPHFIDNLEMDKPTIGGITSVLLKSDKRVVVFSRLDGFIVAVGLDEEIHTPIPDLVEKLIKTAAARSPDLSSSHEAAIIIQEPS